MVAATNILESWPRFERRPFVAQVEGGEHWALPRGRIFDPLDLGARLDLIHANPDLIVDVVPGVDFFGNARPDLILAQLCHVCTSALAWAHYRERELFW
eukprot:1684575-Prymnesium_polylepis.1